MKKIIFTLCVISWSGLANAQQDSSYHPISDSLKIKVVDTIRIGNMIIVSDKNIITDKNKTGSYEMGHGLVKINLNGKDKGYRRATRVAIKEKSDNRNASLYVKSFKDTLLTIHNDTVQLGRLQIINKDEAEYNKDLGSLLDGDFKKTKITFNRTPKQLKNITTNWWIFDLGFANFQDNTQNKTAPIGNLPNSSYLKLNNAKSSNVNIWIVQQKVNLYQHYLNLKYGVGIEMYNFRFEQPISFRNDPGNAVYIDNVKFSKDKLFVEYLSVPIQLNFQSNPNNDKSFYASIGISPGYLIQSHTKQISEERGKKKVNGNFNLSNYKMATIGELGIGSVRLYGSCNMTNLFDKNYTNLDLMPFAIGLRFSKF
jgi:hypothetical protein